MNNNRPDIPGYYNEESEINLFVAVPCLGGNVKTKFYASMTKLAILLTQCKISFSFHNLEDCNIISLARNSLVASFLSEPKYTHLLWIDTDIEFNPESVVKLFECRKDIVTGVYPHKSINWDQFRDDLLTTSKHPIYALSRSVPYPITVEADSSQNTPVYDEKLIKLRKGPLGFMLIQRSVFDKLKEHYPDLKIDPGTYLPQTMKPYYWGFFDTLTEDQQFYGEDTAFYKRWTKIGGEVYAHLDIPLNHVGTFVYPGNIRNFM